MVKTIRWGIIGCGDVTEIKSGPGFQKAQNSTLVAVMRRTAEKAEDYARRHQVPRWYDNAGQLINDQDVDAVYIATPPDSHRDYTLQVATAGKPVYVEKPMARNFEECRQMIAVCQEHNVPLFVAYYRRSLPKFLKVKELLDSGIIGKIRTVQIKLYPPFIDTDLDADNLPWRVIPDISGGGYFFDLASHILDILDFYFGPIDSAQGIAANAMEKYPAEDVVSSSFIFENGIVGNGVWCFSTDRNEDIIEIFGERGKITFSAFTAAPLKLITADDEKSWKIENPKYIQLPHIQSIVDELLGTGTCPSHGENAARTSRIMDQMIENWRKLKGIKFL
jgi:predicted dehydrogenase